MVIRHHTKDKGDIAVAKAIADLTCRGAVVTVPLTEHAPFDLVVLLDACFYRVQVKYRSATRGSVRLVLVATWSDRHGVHRRPISKDEVDVIAFYCPESDRCYYIDPSQHGSRVSLRVEPTRNNQRIGIDLADAHVTMPPPAVLGAQCPNGRQPSRATSPR